MLLKNKILIISPMRLQGIEIFTIHYTVPIIIVLCGTYVRIVVDG